MLFTQYYLDCLSQASYLVGDEGSGQAVIVDPRRDVDEYLEDAAARGLRVVGVITTHFHADFVAGHLELAQRTGAWIGVGEAVAPGYEHRALADGDRIKLGDVVLEIMATPGHTPESISVVVREHHDDDVPWGVLTGDTLFIGDVGRPDLLASAGVTADELGRMLHGSVQRLMALPDEVRVFPAHGAGSACGKNLSTERQSTIGEQRATNYACQPMSEEEFVAVVTAGQPAAPAYFAFNAALNQRARAVLDGSRELPALDAAGVEAALADGAVVLDTRPREEVSAAGLAGAVNVPVDGRTAETVGMLLEPAQPVILIAPEGAEQEVATRLARIGYDRAVGYLPDPVAYLESHPERVVRSHLVSADEVGSLPEGVVWVDVRNPGEVETGAIPGAVNIPLPQLARRIGELDPTRPLLVSCASGWRSNVAASYLRQQGFDDVSDLVGGYAAWAEAQGVAPAACPSTAAAPG